MPIRRMSEFGLGALDGTPMNRRWSTPVALHRYAERLESLRVFGRLPDTVVSKRTEAGVRKASREETAGEFAPTLVSVYGEFAAGA